jgi:hypothetical protein
MDRHGCNVSDRFRHTVQAWPSSKRSHSHDTYLRMKRLLISESSDQKLHLKNFGAIIFIRIDQRRGI